MQCKQIPAIRFDHFHYKLINSPEPVHINNYIEVTYKCNLSCKHCYVPRKKYPAQELPTEEMKRFIELFVDSGCIWLSFSGGEPFIRPDFLELYSFAKSKGLLVGILTNGTLIDKAIAQALAEDPPLSIDVTLYGASEKTYESLTGVGKAFHQCLAGIDNLLEAGIKPLLQTSVNVLNKNDIPAIRKFAEQRQVKYACDPHMHPRIDGDKFPLTLMLSPREISEMMTSEYVAHASFKEYLEEYAYQPLEKRLVRCGILLEGFWMDPYGRLRMCSIVPEPTYDLRLGGSLWEAWKMFDAYIKNYERTIEKQMDKDYSSCVNCNLGFFCFHCVGYSEVMHNRWDRKVDYLCEITRHEVEILKNMGLWPQPPVATPFYEEENHAAKTQSLS